MDKEVPTNVRGVHSLLGAGRQSILRRKEGKHIKIKEKNSFHLYKNITFKCGTDLIRKLSREQYVARQNQKPRLLPHDLVHPPNTGNFRDTATIKM